MKEMQENDDDVIDAAKITSRDVGAEDAKARADAKEEEEQISQQEYDAVQLARRLDFKKHVHRVSIGFLYGISFAYCVAACIWMWHLLAPESWHFMSEGNYATLQSLLFGTIIGGLASQFANKVFSK